MDVFPWILLSSDYSITNKLEMIRLVGVNADEFTKLAFTVRVLCMSSQLIHSKPKAIE